jgi:hypothetical protein
MEALVRNWDGFDGNQTNTYIYNNVEAKAEPQCRKKDINWEFILNGIDQTMNTDIGAVIGRQSILVKLTFGDQDTRSCTIRSAPLRTKYSAHTTLPRACCRSLLKQ